MELEFDAENVSIQPRGYEAVTVTLYKPDIAQMIDAIGLDKFLDHFDEDAILEQIGSDKAKKYFDLTEKDDE
jgi:hypothetical protein